MELLLTDLQSFGSINYYCSLIKYKQLLFEQYEHFVKGSYSNRYYIAGAHGRQLLSIPILHSNRNRTPFKALEISYAEDWQKVHWRAIVSAYRKSPWFDFYQDDLMIMYITKYKYIFEWNFASLRLTKKWLHAHWEIQTTDFYKKEYKTENIVDERHQFMPSKREESAIVYPQVFEEKIGFLPNLSILDLLFCEGNNAKNLLTFSSRRG
ncbi:MAG TPA: WbqC family protein [Chitinophagaceae bacterium]|nr:WbqC family protein [Chitinophagaceae bacterium]